jgi:hypothetical protein
MYEKYFRLKNIVYSIKTKDKDFPLFYFDKANSKYILKCFESRQDADLFANEINKKSNQDVGQEIQTDSFTTESILEFAFNMAPKTNSPVIVEVYNAKNSTIDAGPLILYNSKSFVN